MTPNRLLTSVQLFFPKPSGLLFKVWRERSDRPNPIYCPIFRTHFRPVSGFPTHPRYVCPSLLKESSFISILLSSENTMREVVVAVALVIFALRWLLCLISIPACCRRRLLHVRNRSVAETADAVITLRVAAAAAASSLTNEFIIAAGNERTKRRLHGSNEYCQCMPRNSRFERHVYIQ